MATTRQVTWPFVLPPCALAKLPGLLELDLKEKVVTQTMPNTVKDLPTLLNYVTAEEAARAKTGVHKTTNISGVRQGRHRPERDKANQRKCGNCGQAYMVKITKTDQHVQSFHTLVFQIQ